MESSSTSQNSASGGFSTSGSTHAGQGFSDRRDPGAQRSTPGFERRQFTNSLSDLSPEAAELGRAIDQYKLQHRRRFINYEEMLQIIKSLGYARTSASTPSAAGQTGK